jgi:hypothetical protein
MGKPEPSPAALTYRRRTLLFRFFLCLAIVLPLALAAGGVLAVTRVFSEGFEGFESMRGSPLAERESELLIHITDLVGDQTETEERARKWWGSGGVVHLSARGKAHAATGPVRVSCQVILAHEEALATSLFHQQCLDKNALRFVDSRRHLTAAAEANLFSWGDEFFLHTLLDDQTPAGIHFCARKAERVYILAVSGRKLDDPELLEMLLRPRLELLELYRE